MSNTTRINVRSPGGAYTVEIGRNLASSCAAFIAALDPPASSIIVVTDRTVGRCCGTARDALMSIKTPNGVLPLTLPTGEKAKTLQSLSRLHDQAFGALTPPDRDAVVVALGGGAVGDVAGLFAATCLRGLRVIQYPTTLLAMIDSSVGGKTAVNHATGKNLIGAFHHPAAVFADISLLDTLPARQYTAAFAEAIKCGVALNASLFNELSERAFALLSRDVRALARVIELCVCVKARIVALDPGERGERRLLNYGHTLGHALERIGGYRRWLHGEAVAMGMAAAANIGVSMGVTPEYTRRRQLKVLRVFGLPTEIPAWVTDDELLAAVTLDKKRWTGGFRFVLPQRIGGAQTTTVADLRAALAAARAQRPLFDG